MRAVAAVDRGVPRRSGDETFSISLPPLKRWLRMEQGGQGPLLVSTGRSGASSTPEEKKAPVEATEENDDGYPAHPGWQLE